MGQHDETYELIARDAAFYRDATACTCDSTVLGYHRMNCGVYEGGR